MKWDLKLNYLLVVRQLRKIAFLKVKKILENLSFIIKRFYELIQKGISPLAYTVCNVWSI
jgi:ABC-type uncharacterized transport system permease subunit